MLRLNEVRNNLLLCNRLKNNKTNFNKACLVNNFQYTKQYSDSIKSYITSNISFKSSNIESKKNELVEEIKKYYSDNYSSQEVEVFEIIKIPEQYKLAKILFSKRDNNNEIVYSEYDIQNTLYKTQKPEVCSVALDVCEKTNLNLKPEIFEKLLEFKQNSPKKYEYIVNSDILLLYQNNASYFASKLKNVLKYSKLSDFSKIEKDLSMIKNLTNNNLTINSLLNLKYENNEAFEYAINSDILLDKFFTDTNSCNSSNTELLTKNALQEIEKAYSNNSQKNKYLRRYVTSSDDFKNHTELSNYLSNFIVKNNFNVYRADRDTGLFKKISIKNTPLESKTKKIIYLNFLKTKKDMIIPNNGNFSKSSSNKISLFDYIKNKKELTLSDSMLVAKYADEKFINKICHMIISNQITDNRFKSTSFSENFVNRWNNFDENNGTKIKSLLNIKEGCQGVYDSSSTGQCEFILNNNRKCFSYSQASYNKETDTFELVGTVSPEKI